jgi:hypothetical protein
VTDANAQLLDISADHSRYAALMRSFMAQISLSLFRTSVAVEMGVW